MRLQRMRKSTALLAVVALFISAVFGAACFAPLTASAASVTISTADQLMALSGQTSADTVSLTADIDMTGRSWQAIASFTGTWNGNGHVIYGLQGTLFQTVSGTVSNLGVVSDTVSENASDAALFAGQSSATVTNCFAYGTLSAGSENVGGMFGRISGGSVSGCFSCVEVTSTNAGSHYVGGFAGLISGGAVSHCYAAGSVTANGIFMRVAGFANQSDTGNYQTNYTTCQITVPGASLVKASGVNGLYDNQLGITRESPQNPGSQTLSLIQGKDASGTVILTPANGWALSDAYYPRLAAFYSGAWSQKAVDIANVSAAAACFSDTGEVPRLEPAGAVARADYLTGSFYIDRTVDAGVSWQLPQNQTLTISDTVPTTLGGGAFNAFGTLLRMKGVTDAAQNFTDCLIASADIGGLPVSRRIALSVCAVNPYFAVGAGTAAAPFEVPDPASFSHVRLYVNAFSDTAFLQTRDLDFTAAEPGFYPIDNFRGTYEGDGYALVGMTMSDAALESGRTAIGVFGTAISGTIRDLSLIDTEMSVSSALPVGALIGRCIGGGALTVQNVIACEKLSGKTAGGLIGKVDDGASVVLTGCGTTGLLTASAAAVLGGLIGDGQSASLTVSSCYSTAVLSWNNQSGGTFSGLVGIAKSGTIVRDSYFAGMLDDGSYANCYALCTGAIPENCVYNNQTVYDCPPQGIAKSNLQMIGESLSLVGFAANPNGYPVLLFVENARSELTKKASALSTQAVYYQKDYAESGAASYTAGNFAKCYYGEETLSRGVERLSALYSDDVLTTSDFTKGEIVYTAFCRAVSTDIRMTLMTLAADIGTRYILLNNKEQIDVSVQAGSGDCVGAYALIGNAADGGYTCRVTQTVSGFLPVSAGEDMTVRVIMPISRKALTVVAEFSDGSSSTLTGTQSDDGAYLYTIPQSSFAESYRVTIKLSSREEFPWGVFRGIW